MYSLSKDQINEAMSQARLIPEILSEHLQSEESKLFIKALVGYVGKDGAIIKRDDYGPETLKRLFVHMVKVGVSNDE